MMPMQTTYACEAVWNDFETSYNGWYGNADHVILTAQEGTGFQSAKAMQVSGRRSASDGAASAKGLYLSGGTEYDYSVMVYSDTAEEFSLSLLCIDDEIGAETTTVLASENVNAGTWTKLSASFEAPTEQMRKASNAKIRIMRDAELRNAIADFEQRKVKLQETEEKADIVVSRLSYGVLIIENDL
jgi:hypothetical protein